MEQIVAVIERGDDGKYSVYMQETEYDFALFGFGETVEQAKNDFLSSYADLKSFKSVPNFEFVFKYDVASFLEAYSKKLSLTGLQAITGINRKQLSHYLTGHRKPSASTVKKIQEGITLFSQELQEVSFE